MDLSDDVLTGETAKQPSDLLSSDDTVYPKAGSQGGEQDAYALKHPDEALHSGSDNDTYDDSSDSDGGLVMSRRKSAAKQGQQRNSGSHNHSLSASSRSSRRGSDNTMKKLSPRESTDEQQELNAEDEGS